MRSALFLLRGYTLYLDARPCQVIKSRWYEPFRNYKAMTMYMPRGEFTDFLLYVPEGLTTVYVVPRGKISHNTSWSETALEPYKDAWHLLKEAAPDLFQRTTESMSGQLQKIISEAKKQNLSYALIRSKRAEQNNDYRTYRQRRILIEGKRCAVFTACILPESTHPWPTAIFQTPKDDWAEVLLYILGDDVYVVLRRRMPLETTLDLESTLIYDYKNGWCVFKDIDPTTGRPFT